MKEQEIKNEDRNFKENKQGGIDCERFIQSINGYAPYTMTEDEAQAVDPDLVEALTEAQKTAIEADNAASQAKLAQAQEKLTGIEFEGVMCSATKEDSDGLLAALKWLEAGGETKFYFKNGNTLQLTQANYLEFQTVWMPFRQSFFV